MDGLLWFNDWAMLRRESLLCRGHFLGLKLCMALIHSVLNIHYVGVASEQQNLPVSSRWALCRRCVIVVWCCDYHFRHAVSSICTCAYPAPSPSPSQSHVSLPPTIHPPSLLPSLSLTLSFPPSSTNCPARSCKCRTDSGSASGHPSAQVANPAVLSGDSAP